MSFSTYTDQLLAPLSSSPGLKASLALVHFLWQGVLITAIAAVLMRLIARRSPQRRYLIGMTGIVLMALAPIITFVCVTPPPPLPTVTLTLEPLTDPQLDPLLEVEELDALLAALGPEFQPHSEPPAAEPVPPLNWREQLQLWQPYALALWLTGSALFALRLAIGVRGIWCFSRAARPLPGEWTASAAKVASRLGLKAPRIFVSDRVVEAVAIGFLKPMVLVPTSWIGNVPLDVLEAVLAHELVHLKRYDLWANLLQRCVETVLFYHPAVWWLSRQVRIEREYCCDETAATAISGRAAYARALEFVATERVAATRPHLYGTALAAGMGRNHMALLNRVHRVLAADGKPPRSSWLSEGLLALALPLALWAGIATVGPALAQAEEPVEASHHDEDHNEVPPDASVSPSTQEDIPTFDDADNPKPGEGPFELLGPPEVLEVDGKRLFRYRIRDGRKVVSSSLREQDDVTIDLDHPLPPIEPPSPPKLEKVPGADRLFRHKIQVARPIDMLVKRPVDPLTEQTLRELREEVKTLRKELEELRGSKKANAHPNPRLESALDKPISLSLNEVPLNKVIDQLRDQAETNFVIDQAGLDEEGVTTETPVSIGVNDISLRSALNLILTPMNLGYVHEDEVIKITSRTRTFGPYDVKTYPVGDLLTPADDGKEKKGKEATKAPMKLDTLIELITGTIEPNSWDIVGGQGIIRPNPQTQSLVIRQSQHVHDSIENLLETLRRLSTNAASSPSARPHNSTDVLADPIELERLLKASKFSSLHRDYQEAVAAHEKALRIWQEAQRTHAADPSIGAIFLERAQRAQQKVDKLAEEMAKQGLAIPRIKTLPPPVIQQFKAPEPAEIELFGDGQKYRVQIHRRVPKPEPAPVAPATPTKPLAPSTPKLHDPPAPPSAPAKPSPTPLIQDTPPSPPVPMTGDATKATNISRVTTLDIDGKKVEVIIEEIRDPDSKGPAKDVRVRVLRKSSEGAKVFSDPGAAQRALEADEGVTESSEENHQNPQTTPSSKDSKEPEVFSPSTTQPADPQLQESGNNHEARLNELRSALEKTRRLLGIPDFDGQAPPPETVVGEILDTRTSDVSGKEYVLISLGRDDGLVKGNTLYAYRGNKHLGRIKLTNIYPDRSVGQVIEQETDATIQAEDTVRLHKKREQ